MKNERFNLASKVKKYIFMIDDLVINYPRKDYVLKDRLLNTSYDLLELVYKANMNKDRFNIQMDILVKISLLDYYLETSYNKKIISEKKLSNCTNYLGEIAKMVYGWVDADKTQ